MYVYIVTYYESDPSGNCESYLAIDSVWSSQEKAEKRAKAIDGYVERYGVDSQE